MSITNKQGNISNEWLKFKNFLNVFPGIYGCYTSQQDQGDKRCSMKHHHKYKQRSTQATMGTTTISETSPNESLNRTTSNSIGSERVLHVQSEKTLKEKQLSLRHALHIAPPLPVAASRCRPSQRCGTSPFRKVRSAASAPVNKPLILQ